MSEQETEMEELPQLQQWRFEGTEPTRQDVLKLLATVPPAYGVKIIDYAEYVHALPQSEKKKRTLVNERTKKEYTEDYRVPYWTIYPSVACRLKMLADAAQLNNWVTEFIPEPHTETGSAGIVFRGDAKVAYRVALVIHKEMEDGSLRLVGSRTGVAARSGDDNWEKAETAATGRAIAAWAIGVVPGAGIASLDEMQTAERSTGPGPSTKREPNGPSHEDLVQEIKVIVEQIRTELGNTYEVQQEKVRDYLMKNMGYKFDAIWDDREAQVIWEPVQTAHLLFYRDTIRKYLVSLKGEEGS